MKAPLIRQDEGALVVPPGFAASLPGRPQQPVAWLRPSNGGQAARAYPGTIPVCARSREGISAGTAAAFHPGGSLGTGGRRTRLRHYLSACIVCIMIASGSGVVKTKIDRSWCLCARLSLNLIARPEWCKHSAKATGDLRSDPTGPPPEEGDFGTAGLHGHSVGPVTYLNTRTDHLRHAIQTVDPTQSAVLPPVPALRTPLLLASDHCGKVWRCWSGRPFR